MSKMSQGEREFVSDFGSALPRIDSPPTTPVGLTPLGSSQEIDARALSAPLPLLRAHRALRTVPPGQEVRVVTSYEGSLAEFQALAKYATNFDLVSQDIVGDDYVHVLRRRR
jgi:tRNA 2-thiouridine synthesizing protein A